MKTLFKSSLCLAILLVVAWAQPGYAQGVTTSSVTGVVVDAQKLAVPGATVQAVHVPSGTTYETVTHADGRFTIPGMRVGGPYTVTATLSGFQPHVVKDINLALGVATDLTLTLQTVALEQEVTVVGNSPIFSPTQTGAATTITQQQVTSLPSASNQLSDVARLTTQSTGTMQFAGADNRMNNITVDGSYFNNSFGLAGTPGDRTGVAPISLQAIEAVQVNIAPFDVRQGNFVGAGVNTVTRSGGNQWRVSGGYQYRNNSMVGTKAGDNAYNPGNFRFANTSLWGSGPIVKNKAFMFVNYEDEGNTQPGTTYVANTGGQAVAGNVTRVLASDLDQLSSFLKDKFNYATGPYQGYDSNTPARRFLTRIDYNLGSKSKLTMRYNHLDSSTDVLLSNSSSLGKGTRRSNSDGLNFAASNYSILENIRSFITELNTIIGSNMSNTLIGGYTYQNESRGDVGKIFPFVDILNGGTVYTSFGTEPFSPNNELRYSTWQFQDNFSWYLKSHTLAFGGSFEKYHSENVYYPGMQSVYVYNSLQDFYTDANGYLANPNRTVAPVTASMFQVRWMNIPGMSKPIQPLDVYYMGAYAQDEWQMNDRMKFTYGMRLDVPFFGNTGYDNYLADGMRFRNEDGSPAYYTSNQLPSPNVLWSPRAGFNYALDEERNTQIRGGFGMFTGKPAYVWISNQIGNTGVLTGYKSVTNTTAYPFNPNNTAYYPTAPVTGAPASSYELDVTAPDFKFPQVWRNNIAVDRKMPGGVILTGEFMYSNDINGIYYINANLPAAQTAFVGADNRPRWTSNKINSAVTSAIVLKNQDKGRAYDISFSAEKTFKGGLWFKGGYNYRMAKNTVDAGSVASGSFNNNPVPGDPNLAPLGISNQGNRVFLAASYKMNLLKFGATTVSAFFEGYNQGAVSYTYSSDLNGDGGYNDLIYIPKDQSEMNFKSLTSGSVTYTPAQQAAAWDAYINQDPYLSKHRGQYAQRGGLLMPMVYHLDMSFTQDLFGNIGGKKNNMQLRVDVMNFGNLLNHNWGVGQRVFSSQPLTSAGADSQGRVTYNFRTVSTGGALISNTFVPTAGLGDVYRLQVSVRYTFN